MELQLLVNGLIGFAFFCGGWIMKILWSSITGLTKRVQQLDVLVAGNYVPRKELKEIFDKLFDKLDKIHDQMRKK